MNDIFNVYENYINRERFIAKQSNDSYKLYLLEELERVFQSQKEEYIQCKICGCFFNFFGISAKELSKQIYYLKENNCGCKNLINS